MTHTYQITGMTCSGCEAKVKSNLLSLQDVTDAKVSKDTGTATITMGNHVSLFAFQQALGGAESKYKISATHHNETVEQTRSLFTTYKPLILIFTFITGISLITSATENHVNGMLFMNNFMAGFFITFSFFKLLDLKGFSESYSMYDVVAKKIKSYGLIYPFIELVLGILYLIQYHPAFTNTVTIIVMGVSSIGVIKSVINKQQIRCACLGAVFNLPMSTVTIIEDLLMICMAGAYFLIY